MSAPEIVSRDPPALTAGDGRDPAASTVPALHAMASGCGDGTGFYAIPDDLDGSCAGPEIGFPNFRSYSLPIVLLFTDSLFHNSPDGTQRYGTIPGVTVPTYTDAVGELNAIHARVVGLTTGGAASAEARRHLEALCRDTGSTYLDADAIRMPLVYEVAGTTDEWSEALREAVTAAVESTPMDVTGTMSDADEDEVDTVETFVEHIETYDGVGCATSSTIDTDGDEHSDTFRDIVPGRRVCYALTLRDRALLEPGGPPARYDATFTVWGAYCTLLYEQTIHFIVSW